MSGTIYNPSAGNVYYNTSGSAISAQPVLTGEAIGLGSDRTLLKSQALGVATPLDFQGSRIYATNKNGIITSKLGSNVVITSVAASGGVAVYTLNTHGLLVGQVMYVTDTNNKVTGIQRITAKTTHTFTTDKTYTSGAGTLGYKLISGTLAYSASRYSVIRKVSTTINNVSNTALLSGASDVGKRQSPHKVLTAFRHDGKATAIRAGYWNEYSGTWSTAPTATNSSIGNVSGSTVTDGSADNEGNVSRSIAAELVYRSGKPAPVMANYPLPTS